MMGKTRLGVIWTLSAVLGLSVLVTDTRAHDYAHPYWGHGYGWSYGLYYGHRISLYTSGQVPIPPYFSLHPPVYYSFPVARTYGYSPYAYPPGIMTPDARLHRPKAIRNGFVPQKATGVVSRDKVAATPLRIRNPYVTDWDYTSRVGAGAMAVRQERQPQVVFPMTAAAER